MSSVMLERGNGGGRTTLGQLREPQRPRGRVAPGLGRNRRHCAAPAAQQGGNQCPVGAVQAVVGITPGARAGAPRHGPRGRVP